MTAVDNSGIVPILLVRLRPGPGVRETQRVVHVVPVPETDGVLPDVLTAWCAFKIQPGAAEVLERFAGMPCERCLAKAPTPEGKRLGEAMRGAFP
ncbi:hypothetical protein SAMN05192558_109147 [Actinokineospora alba]|uniref:Uncharacterized protein n=1 Tax=Actinokineospora alba TaxID=504798 RepID=A0A1H0SYW1_9PSEU|nr:hypothetical protein C8E96_1997 [Actinokineospora alba]SDJ52852.1 hypothetical protein SAMN05421871_11857 [Actinokineospora alba]SDP46418.1 hypothetical protein SAMN05192558_109147 [Actinokineospora alba]